MTFKNISHNGQKCILTCNGIYLKRDFLAVNNLTVIHKYYFYLTAAV